MLDDIPANAMTFLCPELLTRKSFPHRSGRSSKCTWKLKVTCMLMSMSYISIFTFSLCRIYSYSNKFQQSCTNPFLDIVVIKKTCFPFQTMHCIWFGVLFVNYYGRIVDLWIIWRKIRYWPILNLLNLEGRVCLGLEEEFEYKWDVNLIK